MTKVQENKKNIWIINPYININDTSSRQASMARYLQNAGHNVTILTTNYGFVNDNDGKMQKITIDDITFFTININLSKLGQIRRVISQLRFQKIIKRKAVKKLCAPDIIINNFSGIFGNFAFSFSKRYNTRVIFDILDLWPEVWIDLGYIKHKNPLTKFLFKKEYVSYLKSDAVIFSFPGGKDYIKEKKWDIENGGKIDLNKIYYINNAVDLQLVNDKAYANHFSDDRLEKNGKFRIGYIGSIGKPNDINLLIDTAKIASKQNKKNIEFIIYGMGSEFESAKKKIKEYQLNNIVFLGRLEKRFFVTAIQQCNIAILNFKEIPTLRFGLSNNKFFMYCASQMPVLSTVHPRYSVIEQYRCGLIVQHNPQAVLHGIETFMNMSEEEYNLYKQNAIKVSEDFDYNKTLEILLDIIE